ncbi:MAG: hypothetical protein ABIT38_12460 [Gemmatimonadaceae bacterium]
MDRHSPNALRSRPRRPVPRRPSARGARAIPIPDGRVRALWAFGIFAALALFPMLSGAQGLRSNVAWVTLTATKRSDADSASRGNLGRTPRGPMVADIEIASPRPAATFDSSALAEIRVDDTNAHGATLWVRDDDDHLVAVTDHWMKLALSPWLRFRAIAGVVTSLGAERWLVRYRRVSSDGSSIGHEGRVITIATPGGAGR